MCAGSYVCVRVLHINQLGLKPYPVIYADASPVRGHK